MIKVRDKVTSCSFYFSSGGNLSCVVVFVCIYYFMVAGGMWLIILAYSLHTSFKSYGEF